MTNGKTITYTYIANSDKLQSYNNESCVYDLIGNPTTYRGKSLEWSHVNHLRNFNGVQFDYNADGIRRKKINGSNSTKFYYAGDKLLAEHRQPDGLVQNTIPTLYVESEMLPLDELYIYCKKNETEKILIYLYGVAGVRGFTIRQNNSEITYYYQKNIMGDVTHIVESNGTVQAKYIYDAWGNHIVLNPDDTENSNPDFIGNINPFRYRSYYYDVETGLYYLLSRYYDPETGRFINMDDIDYLDYASINGLNLYAYCLNNPVNYYDPTGNIAITISFGTALLIALGVIAVGATVIAAITPQTYYNNTWAQDLRYFFVSTIPAWWNSLFAGNTMITSLSMPFADTWTSEFNISYFKEHTSNKRKSNWDKHSGPRSGGPEKKDPRMPYQKWKRPPIVFFPMSLDDEHFKNNLYYMYF